MISYEDLVYALNDWRARQGLPITSAAAAPGAPAGRPSAVAPSMAPPAARAAAPAPAWVPDPETLAQPPLEVGADDAFSIEGEEYADAGEAMAFDSARPGTAPGFAPVAGGAPAPGQRR
jgi:hypothetical protein